MAEASPYFEAFKYVPLKSWRQLHSNSPLYCTCRKTNKEVLFVYSPIDDFVMTNVAEFNGRKVISAETAKLEIEDTDDASIRKLSEEEQRQFGAWLKLTLEDSIKEVKVGTVYPSQCWLRILTVRLAVPSSLLV